MSHLIDLAEASIPGPGQRTLLRLHGKTIAVFNVDNTLYAIDDSCPHAGGSLLSGKLDGRMLQCPAHGLKFDLASGCMRGGGLAVATYAVTWIHHRPMIAFPNSPLRTTP